MKKRILLTLGILVCGLSTLSAQIFFSFTYKDDDGVGFNDPTWGEIRRKSLETAASILASYFVTPSPVTITYSVTSINDSGDSLLAYASSDLISMDPGFWNTVVQEKILRGLDANGDAFDGEITFNFAYSWSYAENADEVPDDAYDFISTGMHEILHSFGFMSNLDAQGRGANRAPSGSPDAWTIFDSFFTDINGIALITETYGYNTSVGLGPLTGGGEGKPFEGVFFNGPNARAGYGGQPVQIFSPDPYQEGSSFHHTNDYTFKEPSGLNAEQLMNSATSQGPGIRFLSPVELGILKDIGYAVVVVPEPSVAALLMLAGVSFCLVAYRGFRRGGLG